jgi:hypothetical protein
MLIEGPSLEARHGRRLVGVAVLLMRFQLGESHRAQASIEVKIALGLGAGLTIGQAGTLFTVAKQKLDLEARLVVAVERRRIQVDICAKKETVVKTPGLSSPCMME